MINCNDCNYVNITEQQQYEHYEHTKNILDHICMKYKAKVIHRSSNNKIVHDYIYPCKECEGKDFTKK